MSDRVEIEFGGGAALLAQGAIAGSALTDLGDRIARLVGRVSRGIADSLLAAGKVVAPGAGAAIATLAAPPAGVYEIQVLANIGAAAAVADAENTELRAGATPILSPLSLGASAGAEYSAIQIRRTLDGLTALSVNAIGAGTAGAPYGANIVATRIE